MTRLDGGLLAVRPGRPARDVHDEVAVDVDRQLRPVVEAYLELAVERGADPLSVAIGDLRHGPTNGVSTINVRSAGVDGCPRIQS